MDQFIFYADRIVSVSEPYVNDKFVATHHRHIGVSDIEGLLPVYGQISASNQLLTGLLTGLAAQSGGLPVTVVDIGVFMGSFSNGVSLISKRMQIPLTIDAYEANPQLISALIKNFKLYGSKVKLHWCGIGREQGSMELVVSPGGAIGASLANTAARKYGDYFACDVDVAPLSAVLKDEARPALVKIDIEGFEVPAFASIAQSANRLNNVFIIEFAPKQAAEMVGPNLPFGEFLLEHFRIYNIGNWAWFRKAQRLATLEELVGVDLGNGGGNTDLLLLPKGVELALNIE